tara:strand:+ start:468 stop:650 length:183 start_codon:yes stop_codon:yes gene_type:complete
MLESIFSELQELLWGLGIVSFAIVVLLMLPKKFSDKLGQHPVILTFMFFSILYAIIKVFN